jgi:DNA mismatch endonuclease (patch repair protein)
MVDTWTVKKRSEVMARIRNKGNRSTELRFIVLLRGAGIKGWRRHVKMPGKPDFIFPKMKVAIFVDGDFWHGNPATFRPPKSNIDFWRKKINYNRQNDRRITVALKKRGWKVLRLWESDLKREPEKALLDVRRHLIEDEAKSPSPIKNKKKDRG